MATDNAYQTVRTLEQHYEQVNPEQATISWKGIHNSTVVATIANITTFLIEIAGHHKKVKTNKEQVNRDKILGIWYLGKKEYI